MLIEAALNVPCGIARAPVKILAAAMGAAAGIVREMAIAMEAIAESSPILNKAFAVLVEAPIDALASSLICIGKLVKSAMAPAAHIIRAPSMVLAAVAGMAPEVWRGLGKLLAAATTTAPSLQWGNAFLQLMEAIQPVQLSIRKRGTKTIVAPAVTMIPFVGLAFALMMAAFAATSAQTLLGTAKQLTAVLSPVATFFTTPAKILFAALNTPADIIKRAFISISRKLAATPTDNKAIRLRRAASLTAAPSIRKLALIELLAQTILDSALESVMLAKRLLDAGVSIATAIAKAARLHLSARQSAAPRLTRIMLAARLLEATSIVGVILWKGLWLGMDAAIGSAAATNKMALKHLRAAVTLSTRTLVTYFFVLKSKLTASIDFRKWRFVPVLLYTSVTQYASMARFRGAILAASVAVNGLLIRLIGKTMRASIAVKTALHRCLMRILQAVSSLTAKLGIGAAIYMLLEACTSIAPFIGQQKTLKMLIKATVSILEAVEKGISIAIFASKRLASSVGKLVYKSLATLSQVIVGSLDKALSYIVVLSVELPIMAEIGSAVTKTIDLLATIAAYPFRQLHIGKRMAAAINLLGSLARHWPMTLAASLSLSAMLTFTNAARKLYDLARTAWAPLRKRIWKP